MTSSQSSSRVLELATLGETQMDTALPMTVTELAIAQLAAYNAHDLDAFCACYHEHVRVISETGEVLLEGKQAFRQQYEPMFSRRNFGATVLERIVLAEHCVEREAWWKKEPSTEQILRGEVLVRYTENDAKIATVVFLRAHDPK